MTEGRTGNMRLTTSPIVTEPTLSSGRDWVGIVDTRADRRGTWHWDNAALDLYDVEDLRAVAEEVVDTVRARIHRWLPNMAVEHVGATALPSGKTKGDVDVALRPTADEFPNVVAILKSHFEVAQPENRRPTFASFSDPGARLLLGIQVSVLGSEDDVLVAIRDRLIEDERARKAYDSCKEEAAGGTSDQYWAAKHRFLQRLLAELRR